MGSLAVITYADTPGYRRGVRRIDNCLSQLGFGGEFLPYLSLPPGSPSHKDAPYGFKAFCLADAFSRGYEQVLYLDASTVILKPISTIFEVINRKGYYLHVSEDDLLGTIGRYCSDVALSIYGVPRRSVLDKKYHVGSFLGLSATPVCFEFIERFKKHCFDGSLEHAGGEFDEYWWSARTDPLQIGHRQQSVTTLLAESLGMTDVTGLASVRPFNHEPFENWMISSESVLWSDRQYVKTVPLT